VVKIGSVFALDTLPVVVTTMAADKFDVVSEYTPHTNDVMFIIKKKLLNAFPRILTKIQPHRTRCFRCKFYKLY